MRKKDHIHKYYRVDIGVNKPYIVYRCAEPDCAHYLTPELVVGKLSKCWRCGGPFQIRKGKLLAKPHCNSCKRPKQEEKCEQELVQHFLSTLFPPEDRG